MNDDDFAKRLAAYEDALAHGTPDSALGTDQDERLIEAFQCVELLNRVWMPSQANGDLPDQAAVDTDADIRPGTDNTAHGRVVASPSVNQGITDSLGECLHKIGRFEILRQLGQGGSGIVFLARDTELGRHVALKVPRPETLFTPELRRRFLQEARAAAALSHPGIVPVYDAGSLGPICYIASEYCPGQSLASWLSDRNAVSCRLAAEWMVLLAEAVEHAHQRGVLHRDLKPGNVLLVQPGMPVGSANEEYEDLSKDCDTVPRITDFGLAKLESSDVTATRSGTLLGTAGYMAPEQVEGRTSAIDRRTDVYGLGTILYELLTGQPPFREATDIATLVAVRQLDPVRPSKLRSSIPPDLEAICLVCLEKDSHKRYTTAAELAADLRRFLAGEPTFVRPIGAIRRSLKWAARHRLLSALVTVIIGSSLILMVGSVWHARRLQQELDNYHELLYAADMRLAHQAVLEKDATRAAQLLEMHIPNAGNKDYRDVEWYFLRRQAVGEQTLIDDVGTPTYDLVFSPDGSRLATAGKDAVLRVYDWPSGKRLIETDTGQIENNGVAFSEDGKTILTTGDDGTIKFWNEFRLTKTIKAHEDEAHGIAFSSATDSWISHGNEPVIRMWDGHSGESCGVLEGHTKGVTSIAAFQSKGMLASLGRDQTVRIWDLQSKQEVRSWNLNRRGTCVTISADDQELVFGKLDGQIELLRVEGWNKLQNMMPIHAVSSVALANDGRILAAGNERGAIWLWSREDVDAGTSAEPDFLSSWQAHDGVVCDLGFIRDASELISVGDDGKLIRWHRPSGRLVHRTVDTVGHVHSIASFSDSSRIATAGRSGVSIVDVQDDSVVRELNAEHSDWFSVAIASEATPIAAARKNGEIWIWRGYTESEPPTIYKLKPAAAQLALSADGRILAVFCSETDDGIALIDLTTGTTYSELFTKSCSSLALSHDGRLLAIGEQDTNDIVIWDARRHKILKTLDRHEDTVASLAFSPDSTKLATLDDGANLILWNVETGRENWSATSSSPRIQRTGYLSIAFSPTGSSIATSNGLGVLSIWQVTSGREMIVLGEEPQYIETLVFCDHSNYLCGVKSNRLCVMETGMATDESRRHD